MLKLLISLLLVVIIPSKSISKVDCSTFNHKNYLYDYKKMFKQYPDEVIKLADKLEAKKDILHLQYKDKEDLLESVHIIWVETHKDKIFTARHVASLVVVESKFNQYALNRKDGGKGLTQTMKKYWKEELPWYTNPYNKKQSVCAGVSVLRIIKDRKKCNTWEAIRRYNSSSPKSIIYKEKVLSVYKHLA